MKNPLIYQNWLNELKQSSDKDFLSFAEDLLNLIVKENRTKFKTFDEKFKKEKELLEESCQKAISQLTPIYNQVKAAALRSKKADNELQYINDYEGYVKKQRIIIPDDPAVELNTAIRLTLELFINKGRLKQFMKYMKKDKGFFYLNNYNFPDYINYLSLIDKNRDEKEISPFGAYDYLIHMIPILKNMKWDDFNWLRRQIISKFIKLIFYVTTPSNLESQRVKLKLGMKGLYSLSENPPDIYYEGINRDQKRWRKIKGKTQSFATLSYFAQKIKEKPGEGEIKTIRLPFKAINEYINITNNCDHPPRWKQIVLPIRQAKTLVKNIIYAVGFSPREILVEEGEKGVYIVLNSLA